MLIKPRFPIYLLYFIIALSAFYYGCRKKDSYDTSPSLKLSFSTNLVKFDTVFTSVGSATHNFTAKNGNKSAVKISHIMLQGGTSSYFRLNIDGRATTDFKDHELAAGDSMYIFAEVTVDPNIANIPFIVSDTVLFILNGHTQKVALQAYGRNAHFIDNQYVTCNDVWKNDGIPYVLYDVSFIKTGCSLTIEKGVTVYCHPKAILYVNGTLTTNGTKDEPVTFRQDRLEHSYDKEPGQWFGIRFLDSSVNSVMTHTIISNATVAIEVDSLTIPPFNGKPKLVLNKCILKNNSNTALACFGADVNATNTLFYSSGLFNLYANLGGTYNFTHCTFENSNDVVTNSEPSVQVGNQLYKNTDSQATTLNLHANFRNCIIYGSLDDEVKLMNFKNNGNAFDTIFYHNIIKATKVGFNKTNIISKNPAFKNTGNGDYHLDAASPAINKGVTYPPIPVNDDLDDVVRKTPTDTIPDIGAYEFH